MNPNPKKLFPTKPKQKKIYEPNPKSHPKFPLYSTIYNFFYSNITFFVPQNAHFLPTLFWFGYSTTIQTHNMMRCIRALLHLKMTLPFDLQILLSTPISHSLSTFIFLPLTFSLPHPQCLYILLPYDFWSQPSQV